MAVKTQPATVNQPVVLDSSTNLEYLRQQKREIQAAIKEAEAASRGNKQERLAREIESQELAPNRSLTYDMFAFVNRRTQLGQSPKEAKQAVLAFCSRLIDEGLATGNPCVAWHAAKASK